jgi:hypothetical protein
MLKTKIAIGCLVQWYEVDVVKDYIQSLREAIDLYGNKFVQVDFIFSINQSLEKATSSDVILKCKEQFQNLMNKYQFEFVTTQGLFTIADYRRTFNTHFCTTSDVLVWGESDMIVPKQMFIIIDQLHQLVNQNNPKYLATFGICKMWDDSWKSLEHPEFTIHSHSDSKTDWWCVNYDMTIDEMNAFNDTVQTLDIQLVSPHKFNGCGLVIASEVIKSGVNVPQSTFFVHEDTAFMLITQKLLGMIPQYHIKNILIVHNRKHRNKRNYITGEIGETIGQKRNSNKWYTIANSMCEQNAYNIFNTTYKSYTWQDVWKSI